MAEKEIIWKHRYRDEVLLTGTSRPHLDLGEKCMKTLAHDLAVDQLLTMAPRVESIPVFKRGFFGFPLSLGLIA
jgi:hypothetical protein